MVIARMAGLSPGTSPPPVRMAMVPFLFISERLTAWAKCQEMTVPHLFLRDRVTAQHSIGLLAAQVHDPGGCLLTSGTPRWTSDEIVRSEGWPCKRSGVSRPDLYHAGRVRFSHRAAGVLSLDPIIHLQIFARCGSAVRSPPRPPALPGCWLDKSSCANRSLGRVNGLSPRRD